MHDGVAGDATQTVLRFGSVDLIFDRLLPAAIEEDRVVMATGTPFRSLCGALDLLHVLDRTPVVLVVKAGEVMDGTVPLLVDVFMAFAAKLGIHEEVGGDGGVDVGVCRGGPEGALWACAFFLHGCGDRDRAVGNSLAGCVVGAIVEVSCQGEHREAGECDAVLPADPGDARNRDGDMRREDPGFVRSVAGNG